MVLKDYYKILGIHPNSTAEDIKEAYRRKAHKYHPDTGHGDGNAFKEIHEAYEVLSNEYQRAEYDRNYKNEGDTNSKDQSSTNSEFNFGKSFRKAGDILTKTASVLRTLIVIALLIAFVNY